MATAARIPPPPAYLPHHRARVAGDRIPFARYAGSFLTHTVPTAEAVGYYL
jgi:hypothetical protein